MSDTQHVYPALPEKRHTVRNVVLGAIAAVLILLFGVGIGSASVKETTVTKEVEKEVTVEVVPDACLDALDLADEAFSGFSDVLGSILDGDYDAAESGLAANKKLTAPYLRAKDECREKGRS
jgi:hypothetical protein